MAVLFLLWGERHFGDSVLEVHFWVVFSLCFAFTARGDSVSEVYLWDVVDYAEDSPSWPQDGAHMAVK